MKARGGQVAVYLALVLVAIAVLMLMNVNTYLAVTAKNRAMNAGDAAAKAVAVYQGELLNRIAELNRRHLEVLMPRRVTSGSRRSREERLEEAAAIVREQRLIAFLEPLRGISIANRAARDVGAKESPGMLAILRNHVNDVRSEYMNAPEIYPEPWEGAWSEYASVLEAEISSGIVAGPDNIDFRNASGPTLLTRKSFYTAVAGRCWCWFYFNARSELENYSGYRDWPLPEPGEPQVGNVNSEVYSLDLAERKCRARDLLSDEQIEAMTGRKIEKPAGVFDPQVYEEDLLDEPESVWYVFDSESTWRNWWEIDPDGSWQFPVVGKVKDEFNVRGCAAICRVYEGIVDLMSEKENDPRYEAVWTAAAKPFLTDPVWPEIVEKSSCLVISPEARSGGTEIGFESRLVPVDTVGGKDLSTADHTWITHLKEHLPVYYEDGPGALGGCWYCQQLKVWEQDEVRSQGREFIRSQSSTCIRSQGGGTEKGGTPHGH